MQRPTNGRRPRFSIQEFSGALADLGTLAPLAVGLIAVCGVKATTLFAVTGLMYVLTGLVYRLPVAVQPLKAASALAIAGGLGTGEIAAAAWTIAGLLIVLSFTGLAEMLAELFTKPVVRGIQLGVGLILVKKGIVLATRESIGGAPAVLPTAAAIVLGAIVIGLLIAGIRYKKFPVVLGCLALSLVAVVLVGGDVGLSTLTLGPGAPAPVVPTTAQWLVGVAVLALPQIPLTLGNAVVATKDCAGEYFKERGRGVTPGKLSLTMAIGNSVSALLGSMPMCHGSGGLTAHYRLGARTGGAPLMLGAIFVAVAFIFGESAQLLLLSIPPVTIGILMAFVGVQHALLLRDMTVYRWKLALAIAVGVTGFLTTNLALAFAVGFVAERLRMAVPRWRDRPTQT